jgi:hypothetical protein
MAVSKSGKVLFTKFKLEQTSHKYMGAALKKGQGGIEVQIEDKEIAEEIPQCKRHRNWVIIIQGV